MSRKPTKKQKTTIVIKKADLNVISILKKDIRRSSSCLSDRSMNSATATKEVPEVEMKADEVVEAPRSCQKTQNSKPKKTAAHGVRFADEEPAKEKKGESDEEIEFSREILAPNEKVDKLVKVYWSRKRD